MGTGQNSTNTQKQVSASSKPPRCSLCKKEYTPTCDYMQGRCPHHPAMISSQVATTRIQNLINFFKGNKK